MTVGAAYNPSVTSITMGAFTGTLDFSANNNSPTMQTFNGSGTGTRTLNMGNGTWTITGSGTTIWTTATATNLTLNAGTSTIDCTYSGSTGTRTITTDTATVNTLKISAGTDTVALTTTFRCVDLNFTGFSGTGSFGSGNIAGNLTLGTGMTINTSTSTWTFSATSSKNITSNGVQNNRPYTFDGVGGSWTLQDHLDLDGASARTLTLTNGTFNANNKNVTVGLFVSSNSNTRTITMGSGIWTLTGNNATIWNLGNITGLTFNRGSNAIVSNYSGATGTRTIGHTDTGEASCPSFNFTAGSDGINLSNTRVFNVDFTGYTGALGTGTWLAWGNVTLGAGMSVSATTNAMSMVGTGASTFTLTTNGVSIDRPVTLGGNGSTASTFSLADHLTLGSTRTLTHTAGTLVSNNKNISTGLFSSSNSNTRVINMGTGTWTLTGTGTVWTTATATGLTLTPSTSTITLTDTSTSSKTFAGGGKTFYNLDWTAGGTGALIISGSNAWNNWVGVGAKTLTLTAGTTQTLTSFSSTGSAGNVLTINSSSAGSQASISKSSGTVSADYLSLQDSNATGGATWYAGINSVDVSNNNGWIFSSSPPSGGHYAQGFDTRSSAILFWLQRNSPTHQAGRSANDAWRSFLASQTSMSGTTMDLERHWLAMRITNLGGSPSGLGRNGLWMRYLALKDFGTGTLSERFANWIDHGGI